MFKLNIMMKILITTAVFAFLTSTNAMGKNYNRTITKDQLQRMYMVNIPASYDGTPMPLVIDMHGLGVSAFIQRTVSGWRQLSESEGFIVVHPQGIGSSFNAYRCCSWAQILDLDDVGLMRDIVAAVGEEWNVDLSRVYATGSSNGSSMANRLACEASDLFAGIAGFAYPLANDQDCQPEQPTNVIMYHGTNDTVIPYLGSLLNPSAEEGMENWRKKNGCSSESYISLEEGNTICKTFRDCDNDVNTTLCTVRGASHILYFESDISMQKHAWDILKNYTK